MNKKILFLISVFISQIGFAQQAEKKSWQLKAFKALAIPTVLVGYGLLCENGNGYPSSYDVKNWRDKNFNSFSTKIASLYVNIWKTTCCDFPWIPKKIPASDTAHS